MYDKGASGFAVDSMAAVRTDQLTRLRLRRTVMAKLNHFKLSLTLRIQTMLNMHGNHLRIPQQIRTETQRQRTADVSCYSGGV